MALKLMKTNNGKGFKIVNEKGKWYYTSIKELTHALKNNHPCLFRTLEEFDKKEQPSDEEILNKIFENQ